MAKYTGFIQLKWQCGHSESIESAGWKDCPSCMQKRIAELKARLKASKTFAWESTNRERLIQAGWTPPEALEQD